MFDAIAFRYDRLNHLLSMGVDRQWRSKVVRRVKASHPSTILDLATGTGDLAILLARNCPEAHVTGIDLSEQMLAIGRHKVMQAGLAERITLEQGDAENLPVTDNCFDAATVAFGVRNIPGTASRRSRLCFGIRHAPKQNIRSSVPFLFPSGFAYNRTTDFTRQKRLYLPASIGRRVPLWQTLLQNIV